MSNVKKSIEITDARIKFVSLVDKAANRKSFLLTKQEDGQQGFQSTGRILKVDSDSHYVTGIVYEPMVADAHDNYMTEAEIEKAAHWFMKNGDKIDLQHSFEEAEGLTVVESSVTKADQKIEDVDVKKGTWLMTVEVNNDEVWQAIEKGEITGLSMGGVGNYATQETDLNDVAKAEADAGGVPEKLNLLERLAKALGVESAVVKGEMREKYEQRVRAESFWTAWDSLCSVLRHYDYWNDQVQYEQDETKIRDALADFSEIITELCKGENIAKALHETRPSDEKDSAGSDKEEGEVEKAGRKMSKANKDKLNSIAQQLIEFAKEFDDEPEAAQDDGDDAEENEEKEETDMNKEDIQKMIDDAVAEAVQKAMEPKEEPAEQQVEKAEEAPAEKAESLTAETVQKMLDEAIPEIIPKAVNATRDEMTKAFKQRGLSTAVDEGESDAIEKAEQHYLHGIL